MELHNTLPPTNYFTKQQELFERVVARFECDWILGCPGRWQDYLPEDPEVRELLTLELPLVEEEFRQRSVITSGSSLPGASFPMRHESRLPCSALEPSPTSVSAEVDDTLTQITVDSSHVSVASPEELVSTPLLVDMQAHTRYGEPIRMMRGGLGDVWVLPEANLGRTVVVKQLQERWAGNPRAERAFLREVRITSLLEHPGIVPVHASGRTKDGRPFYSMRYVEGETLREAIEKCHADSSLELTKLRKLLDHFVSVCQTVAYAHSCRVLHRDLKPENIVIGPFGQTVVLDWGLAKQYPVHAEFSEETRASESTIDQANNQNKSSFDSTAGDVLGTPAYMSPEQSRGELSAISIQTDVFGLGAILYTILFGSAPHSQRSSRSVALHPVPMEFPVVRTSGLFASGLIAICRKAMSFHPGDRYPSASALADEVVNWMAGESVSVKHQPLMHRVFRWAGRQTTLAGAVLIFAVLSLLTLTLGYVGIQRERSERLLVAKTAEANAQAMESAAEYISRVFQTAEPLGFDNLGFANAGQMDAQSSLRQMLDQGYQLIDSYYGQQLEQKSNILLAMGYSFRGLAEYSKAELLLNQSLDIRQRLYGLKDGRTLECYYHLGRLAYDRGDYRTSEKLLRQVIHDGQVDSKSAELLVADAQFHLAWLLYYQPLGLEYPQFNPISVSESKQLFAEVIRTRQRRLGDNHPSVGLAYAGYAAACFNDRQQTAAALTAVTKAMEVFRANDQESKLGHFLVEYLRAERLRAEGDSGGAHEAYCMLRETIEEHLGRKHPVYLMHLWNMAGFFRKFQRLDEAETTILQIRELAREMSGFRSSHAHLDGMRQYVEELLKLRPIVAVPILEETMKYAAERPEEHKSLIAHLEQLRKSTSESHQTVVGVSVLKN